MLNRHFIWWLQRQLSRALSQQYCWWYFKEPPMVTTHVGMGNNASGLHNVKYFVIQLSTGFTGSSTGYYMTWWASQAWAKAQEDRTTIGPIARDLLHIYRCYLHVHNVHETSWKDPHAEHGRAQQSFPSMAV